MTRSTIWRAMLFMAALDGVAAALVPVTLDDQRGEYRLGGRLELLEDAEQRFTIDDVRTPPLSESFAVSPSEAPTSG